MGCEIFGTKVKYQVARGESVAQAKNSVEVDRPTLEDTENLDRDVRLTVAALYILDSGLANNPDIPEISLNYKHCILSCPSFLSKSCACTLDQNPSTAVFALKSLRYADVFGEIVTRCHSVVAADRVSTAVSSVFQLALSVASS